MRWVYILKCTNDFYYIGETSRLYRRFWEHNSGKGGVNTSTYEPENIIAIYNLERLGKFFNYNLKVNNNDYSTNYNIYFNRGGIIEIFNDNNNNVNNEDDEYTNLTVENNITEKMMLNNKKNWKKIRGGKYVRLDVEYNFPTNEIVKDLPNCKCKLPCDIKKNEKDNYLYFRCAKKNIWEEMREIFNIDEEPCDFFMKYTKDNNYKIEYEKRKEKIKILTVKSDWLEQLVGCQYEFCIGGCQKRYDENNTIRYLRSAINLCFDCFINKNNELSKKYDNIKFIETF
jgi:hypothetical protein